MSLFNIFLDTHTSNKQHERFNFSKQFGKKIWGFLKSIVALQSSEMKNNFNHSESRLMLSPVKVIIR